MSTDPPRWRRWAKAGVGIAIGGGLLWLVLSGVEREAMLDTLAAADALWVTLGIAAFAAGYACRICRWRAMLSGDNPAIGFRDCAGPFLISIAANNLLPLRAGDALRAVAFHGRLGVGTGGVLATLLVERLLDLLMLLLALLAALAFVLPQAAALPSVLSGLGFGLVGAGALAVCGALLAPRLVEAPVRRLLARLGEALPGLGARLSEGAAHMFSVLARLAGRRSMPGLLGWSVAAWAFEGGVFLAAALALSGPEGGSPAPVAALALPVATLGTLLPGPPGHIGTFDYFAALSAETLGAVPAAAVAFALLVHAMLWLPPVLAAGVALALGQPFRARRSRDAE